ncbi:MAG: hypothetical protein KJ737_24440, partial [Proteobacteria bacterium]|nr:hypothetical protein [Pseudomonadota bacterium]
ITLFSSGVSDLPCPMTMLLSAFPQKITLGAYYIQFSKCIKSFDRNYNWNKKRGQGNDDGNRDGQLNTTLK